MDSKNKKIVMGLGVALLVVVVVAQSNMMHRVAKNLDSANYAAVGTTKAETTKGTTKIRRGQIMTFGPSDATEIVFTGDTKATVTFCGAGGGGGGGGRGWNEWFLTQAGGTQLSIDEQAHLLFLGLPVGFILNQDGSFIDWGQPNPFSNNGTVYGPFNGEKRIGGVGGGGGDAGDCITKDIKGKSGDKLSWSIGTGGEGGTGGDRLWGVVPGNGNNFQVFPIDPSHYATNGEDGGATSVHLEQTNGQYPQSINLGTAEGGRGGMRGFGGDHDGEPMLIMKEFSNWNNQFYIAGGMGGKNDQTYGYSGWDAYGNTSLGDVPNPSPLFVEMFNNLIFRDFYTDWHNGSLGSLGDYPMAQTYYDHTIESVLSTLASGGDGGDGWRNGTTNGGGDLAPGAGLSSGGRGGEYAYDYGVQSPSEQYMKKGGDGSDGDVTNGGGGGGGADGAYVMQDTTLMYQGSSVSTEGGNGGKGGHGTVRIEFN